MTKRAPKKDRREQILQAALTCFARKGYHLTTMDDIVAESGLSKGSLYWHYKNKLDLFLSIMNWYFAQMEQELEASIQAAPTATAKLQTLAEIVAQLFSNPELEPLVNVLVDFYAETRHDAEVEAAMQQVLLPYIEFVANIVEAGVAAGEFKPVNARQIAVALMAAFDGLYLYGLMLRDEFDWTEVSHLLAGVLLNGLCV